MVQLERLELRQLLDSRDEGDVVVGKIKFDERGQLENATHLRDQVVTGHEAFQVAHVRHFESVTLCVLVLDVVVEYGDVLVPQHQGGHFGQVIAEKRILNDDGSRQLHAFLISVVVFVRDGLTREEIYVNVADSFVQFVIKLVEHVVQILQLVFDTLFVVNGARGRRLWSLRHSPESYFLAAWAWLLMVHHCFKNIGLLFSHLLLIGSCCLRSCHYYFRLGSGEGMRLLLSCLFECARLRLHFKHARTLDFAFLGNWCFLQARRLYFGLLHLNWLFGRSVPALHVLLELGLGHELAPALLEWALLVF